MPFRTQDPVLTLEGVCVRNIDPQNPENLYGMWSVFSKCSGIMEHGRRMENLSWRLWNHEALFCSPRHRQCLSTNARSADTLHNSSSRSIPDLSSSIASLSSTAPSDDDDAAASHSASRPADQWSFVKDKSSRDVRMRSPDQHITQNDLEKLVTSIKVKQDLSQPLSPLQVSLPRTEPKAEPDVNAVEHDDDEPDTEPASSTQDGAPTPRPSSPRFTFSPRDSRSSQHSPSPQYSPSAPRHSPSPHNFSSPRPIQQKLPSASSSSKHTLQQSHLSPSLHSEAGSMSDNPHAVIRGFQPGVGVSSYRSQSQLAPAAPTPILKPSAGQGRVPPSGKKKVGMFTLGSSSGEDEHSIRSRLAGRARPSSSKKTTSFNEQVTEIRTFQLPDDDEEDDEEEDADDSDAILETDDDAFEDEDEEGEVSESAIEDEDDDAWEDDVEDRDDGRELRFQRVDSKPNLVSRRSLLTQKVHEDQRALAMQDAAARMSAPPTTLRRSRTSTPNGPSTAASPTSSCATSSSPSATILQPGGLLVPPPRPSLAINPGAAPHPASAPRALSPRTTRRQMLSEELGQSLRQHMLLERRSRPQAAAKAAIQRRHTSHDVQNLKEYPQAPFLGRGGGGGWVGSSGSREDEGVFESGVGEYHQKGW